ncbi:MAG: FG-GAP-like repeat-containing protein, partial [Thermoanaerobaculia bacterium]
MNPATSCPPFIPLKATFAICAITLLTPEIVAGQGRVFRESPDYLLGLRTERSASITFADVDGDGDLDVLVANGRHWPQSNEVFINNGEPADSRHIAPGGGYGRFTL